ncbi:MAG: hypothetical protein MJ010_05490, partial [Paludibacteraceae bacterium]|nr:hypothetical protein [Paludibacteraceae bacterium]
VSKTDPTASSTAVEEAKKITITNISGTALDGTTPKNVIIAVAPATFATDDITLSMTDSDGKVFSTKIGNFNVERSGGHAVAVEVEFETPAPATTGEAEITGGTKVKWIQLWENGPKWAEYNVGATSVGDYGGYYCWGSSENKGSAYPKVTIMIQGTEYDTAKNLWGSNWQMATQEDFGNLIANCDVQWTDNYNGTGKAGRVYTGKSEGYTENSVFFPAAGYYSSSEVKDGDKGNYWTDVSLNKNTSYRFLFDNSTASEAKSFGRGNCLSVRAILKE